VITVIHRYWTGDAPAPCISVLGAQYAAPFAVIRDWTDDTLPDDIKTAVDKVTDYVPEDQRARHRGNVVRLHLLRRFGGLWLDHDVILLSIPSQQAPWLAWAGSSLCSAIMCFDPGDRRLDKAISSIAPAESSVDASGERMLSRLWLGDEGITYHHLAYDRDGVRNPHAHLWAIHDWNTG
jgi:hypothetical protein